MVENIRYYSCDTCFTEHKKEEDAESCCPNTYTEVYYCWKCKEPIDDFDEVHCED